MNKPRIFIYIVIVIMLISFCFSSIVKAEDGIMPLSTDTFDNICYRYCEPRGYNEEHGGYEFYYRVYLSTGLKEGVVYLPEEYYNKNWLLFLNTEGAIRLITCDTPNLTFCLRYGWANQGLVNLRCIDSNNKNYDFKYHRYDLDTNTFSNPDSTDNLNLSFFDAPIEANSFIQSKSMGFSFANADYSQNVSWGSLANWQELKCPTMKLTSTGFRLYVEDFHGSTKSSSTSETVNDLTLLNLYVYDLNTKQYMTIDDNLLALSDLQQADDEKYYLDIPFDYLPYLHINNGDFVLGVGSNLKSEYTLNGFSAESSYNGDIVKANPQITLFEDFSYWRYQYYSSSGTGLLVPTDAEGNPLDPDKPIPEQPDETQQKLEEQIKRLEEQTEAIKQQTEKIEEQTNAIKENNETNKNIFQQIIELPGKIIGLLIDGLKSLFLPSDDFLSNYFNELYEWFCERLGFLSYPVQLFVNILNKILNINWSEPIIHIPDISEPFTGEKLVSATTFNFNSLLTNDVLKNVHNIYLVLVDSVIIFALVNLAKNKFGEVTKS